MSECSLSEEKLKLLELWRKVAKEYFYKGGPHFNFIREREQIEFIRNELKKLQKTNNKEIDEIIRNIGNKIYAQGPTETSNLLDRYGIKMIRELFLDVYLSEDFKNSWVEHFTVKKRNPNSKIWRYFGEFYGKVHIDTHPIWNSASEEGLRFFGFKFKNDDYQDFESKFNEFKENCYKKIVGYATKVEINLEIDQLFNIIDKLRLYKIDKKKIPNRIEERIKLIDKINQINDETLKKFYCVVLKLTDNLKKPVINDYKKIIIQQSKEINLLQFKKQIILYGPPGTGKTYNARKLAVELIELEVY